MENGVKTSSQEIENNCYVRQTVIHRAIGEINTTLERSRDREAERERKKEITRERKKEIKKERERDRDRAGERREIE